MKRILLTSLVMVFVCFGFAQTPGGTDPSNPQETKQPVPTDIFTDQAALNSLLKGEAWNTPSNNASFSSTSGIASSSMQSSDGIVHCATPEVEAMRRAQNPALPSDAEFEAWMREQIKERRALQQMAMLDGPRCDVLYIPYIVHVLHEGEDVNTVGNVVGNNMSAAQVESQMDMMNDAFRKVNYSRNDSPIWDDVASDLQIIFVPAVVDEDDNVLDEPGIDRVDLVAEGLPTNLSQGNLQSTIKPATSWDPERVFNIWVGELNGGLLGYAQFPSMSGLDGMPNDGGDADTDGIVVTTGSFQRAEDDDGSFVTFNSNYDGGATTVHEVGHWIGLRHIWGDGACGVDDFVEDTPTAAGPASGCPTTANTCTDGDDDQRDMVENYMDYSFDNCMNLFTAGQKERVDVVMDLSPRRGSLLESDMADYPDRKPYVMFEVEDLQKDLVEADGCGSFTDFVIRARMLECTDQEGTINVTVVPDAGSEAVLGVDYEFPDGPDATLSGAGPELVDIPVRVFSDGETEGVEDYIFNLTMVSADTDAVLHPDETYLQAVWSIGDATNENGEAVLDFTDEDTGDGNTCVEGDMTLTINFDDFGSETSWEIRDLDSQTVVAQGDGYAGETVYTEDFNLPDGNYAFTIFDDFGDGICCTWGNGSYSLVTAGGQVVAEGGEFGEFEQTNFCVSDDTTFAGVLPLNASVDEVQECGDPYVDYLVGVNLAACVSGETSFDVDVVVDESSTATEGDDFEFIGGNTVSFDGDGPQTEYVTLRIYGDGMSENNETIVLDLESSNESLAPYGETVPQTITIVDVDAPQILYSASVDNIRESDYNCEDTSNTFTLTGTVEGCGSFTEDLVLTLVATEDSEATEGEDFEIIDGTHTITSDNQNEEFEFTVEVYNEYMAEGFEDIVFDIELSDDDAANVTSDNAVVTIMDALGNSEPMIVTVWDYDFENGLPDGWTILSSPESTVNTMIVSDATAMDGNALHVTNDGSSFQYDATAGGFEYLMAVSPPVVLDQSMQLDFDFQVWGEPGFFGNFDFGYYGMLPAGTDPNDPDEILTAALGAQLLLGSADVSTLTDYLGVEEYYPASVFPEDAGQEQRMILAWASDDLFQNQPPAGYDNVNLFSQPGIEEEVVFGSQQPNYPMVAGVDTYFYNTEDGDIMMMINSSAENGCSTAYVDGAGTGATQYISEFPEDWRASKTFVAKPEMASEDDPISVGLYYTEEEIAGWEEATGQSREDLYVFKQEGAFGTCFDTNVTLEINLDNFPTETTWELVNQQTGETTSGGPYGGQAGETITEEFDLEEGGYTFTIFDSFGDGICCGFGEGSYSLTAGNGDVIVEGGDFGDSETTSFCTSEEEEEDDDCRSYEDIEFAPATLEPYANGFKVMASFNTGLWEETGFGISAIPATSPAEFTAEQNNEQIDITFTNKYDESEIAYYIFESVYMDVDESQELETIEADGSGTYMITDYFPRPGLNVYSVTYVLNSGEKVEVCYTAEAFFEVTEETKIYPNPASNEINIVISDDNINGDIMLAVYDEQGRVVKTQEVTATRAVLRHRMDISDLAAGTYYLRITSDSGDENVATFVKIQN